MKKIFLITSLLITTIYLSAQIKFTASAEKVVETGETFKLIFSVNDNAAGFEAPVIRGFRILSGPNPSTSQSFQYINGKSSQSIETSFLYYLQAKKTGKFKIGQAKVMVKGKKYTSKPITIEVIKGSKPDNSSNNNTKYKTSHKDLFVRVNFSKRSAYQGEHLIATIKIYTRVSILGFDNMKFPKYTGFWTKDIQSPTSISLKREKINGKIYEVGLLKQSLLIPQKTGKLTIDPFEIKLYIKEKVGQGRDFFGRLVDRYDRVLKTLRSNPATINIKALPGNKPDNFSGIVGTNFKLETKIDKPKIKTEEGANITVKISGKGNLNLLGELDFVFPNNFESFPPKINEQIRNTAGGSSGFKTYEYFLLARKPGNYKIKPVGFSYFDLNSKSFKELKTDEITINVEKGDGHISSQTTYNNQSEVETIHEDIKYIKKNSFSFSEIGDSIVKSYRFYLSYLILSVLFVLTIIIRRKQIKENADYAKVRNKKANKISRKRLKSAKAYLSENNKEEFYKEILQATWGYMSDKLAIPGSELTKDTIRSVLDERKIDPATIDNLVQMLDTCEYAQYAPVGENEAPENIFKQAEKLITELERKL